MRVKWIALISLSILLLNTGSASAHDAGSPSRAVQDTPFTLVPNGVTTFALVGAQNKIFYHTAMPPCPPVAPSTPKRVTANAERVSRVATYGSLIRVLYEQVGCGSSQIQSNIVADDNYVYWVGSNGLMRLSVNANPGDSPELVNGLFSGRAELAIDGIYIFVLSYDNNNFGTIYKVQKSDGTRIFVTGTSQNTKNLQTSYSFFAGTQRYFVYWLDGTDLRRFNLDTFSSIIISTGVTGYDAEGGRFICALNNCFFSDLVFFARGTQAFTHNNVTGIVSNPIYTSTDPSALVFSLATDDNNLFLLERRDASCPPFTCNADVIVRSGRSNDNTQAPIYNTGALPGLLGADKLTTDGTFLYWQENQSTALRRLPNNAAALSQTNMRIMGIEVTQGIQNLNDSVFLVKNRRTFVRVYVKSDGPAVPGVGAQLTATWNGGGSVLPLTPVNPAKVKNLTQLTIEPSPSRDNINDSFLFDLPLDWTMQSNLVLHAELNPYRAPLQTDYSNNALQIGPLTFVDSPRLSVNLVQFQYMIGNTTYTVPMTDTLTAVSFARRLFPMASTPGWYTDNSPGFRPRLWTLNDAGLGSRVDYTASECNSFIHDVNGKTVDDRNLCATAYANNQLIAYRTEQGLGNQSFMYGLIPAGGKFVPRGQAFSGDLVASGVSSNASTAVHEISHTAGREHPFKGSVDDDKVCGNSKSDGAYDMNYPYADSSIGPPDGSYEGLETGDPSLKIPPAVLPSKQWFDIIGYCGPRWIGDYTYRGIYKYFFPNAQVRPSKATTPRIAGDWLTAFGIIGSGANNGYFTHVRRLSSVADTLPQTGAGYLLRLRNAQGVTLADYGFAPQEMHHGDGMMEFGLVVPFVAGTRSIQLIKGTSLVIGSRAVSANPPSINNVALQGAPNPVTGTVTLGWTASDPDGDPLTFDILYSRDGGASFQPLRFGVSGNSTPIDTRGLGGGSAIMRVIATDGVLSAQADSAPFTLANKPPTPHIYSPGDGTHIQWSQLLTFSGDADDPQDNSVGTNGLVWRDQFGNTLGNGTLFSKTDLRVGTSIVTLMATNSLGLTATASISLIVDDDLRYPGPILAAGPMQVNWQVAPGTSASQTAQVIIENVGGGTLNWAASSDQSWLTLSSGAGSVPFTMTLTADPTGMTDGSMRLANVTIIKPINGNEAAQSLTIPVSLSMGNTEDVFLGVLDKRLFLPLVER